MNYNQLLPRADHAGFAVGAAVLVFLTGCSPSPEAPPAAPASAAPAAQMADAPSAPANEAAPAQVTAASPLFAAQDDYVYYPGYDVYYSNSRHQYAYLEGGTWVSRPSPRGVSIEALRASPSVRMDFHDSPANHHAEIVKRYPKNWVPADQKEPKKDEPRR